MLSLSGAQWTRFLLRTPAGGGVGGGAAARLAPTAARTHAQICSLHAAAQLPPSWHGVQPATGRAGFCSGACRLRHSSIPSELEAVLGLMSPDADDHPDEDAPADEVVGEGSGGPEHRPDSTATATPSDVRRASDALAAAADTLADAPAARAGKSPAAHSKKTSKKEQPVSTAYFPPHPYASEPSPPGRLSGLNRALLRKRRSEGSGADGFVKSDPNRFNRRDVLMGQTSEIASETRLETLPSDPIRVDVVMAPGDARPRIAPPAPRTLSEAATEYLGQLDAESWPRLGEIPQLASGLTATLNVRGVLRVGEDLEQVAREIDHAGVGAHAHTKANTPGAQTASSATATATAATTTTAPFSAAPPAWSQGFATDFEHITHPHLVDLSSTPGFVTASRDTLLLRLARQYACEVMGSTSSTTKILSQLIFALGSFHPIQTDDVLSDDFDALPKRATSAERSPAVLLFRRRRERAETIKDVESEEEEREAMRAIALDDAKPEEAAVSDANGTDSSAAAVDDSNPTASSPSSPATILDHLPSVWAIDSEPSWSNPTNRILMELGNTLEAFFTHEPDEFRRIFLTAHIERRKQRAREHNVLREERLRMRAQTRADSATTTDPRDAETRKAEDEENEAEDLEASESAHSTDAPSAVDPVVVSATSDASQPSSSSRTHSTDDRGSFVFVKMDRIMFRSQLDCWAPELRTREELQSFVQPAETQPTTGAQPNGATTSATSDVHTTSASSSSSSASLTLPSWPAWEKGGLVFDLKTRAVLPIRLFCRRYSDLLDYDLAYDRGLMYSFEREYYDMQRAAFLKYSLQCRIGRMGGVMIGYHNTAKLFGYHYVSVKEMDESLFGHTLIGEWMFDQATKIMNERIADTGPDSILATIESAHARNWRRRRIMERARLEEEKKDADLAEWRAQLTREEDPVDDSSEMMFRESPTSLVTELTELATSNEYEATNAEEVEDPEAVAASNWLEADDAVDATPAAGTISPPTDVAESDAKVPDEDLLDESTPPLLSTLKYTIAASEASSDHVVVFVEMLPADETQDPELTTPFLDRYTSQRRVDAMPNYRVRQYLGELGLDTSGPRVAIVSRLEGALAHKPFAELPPPSVFLWLARQNLIHKFVIRVQHHDLQEEQPTKDVFSTDVVDQEEPTVDPTIIPKHRINDMLQDWADEFKWRDEDHARRARFAKSGAKLSHDAPVSDQRSAGARGVPLSPDSFAVRPSQLVTVATSLTHFSVDNRRITPDDLAADYRRTLVLAKSAEDRGQQEEVDMAKALAMTMQSLVDSRKRSDRAKSKQIKKATKAAKDGEVVPEDDVTEAEAIAAREFGPQLPSDDELTSAAAAEATKAATKSSSSPAPQTLKAYSLIRSAFLRHRPTVPAVAPVPGPISESVTTATEPPAVADSATVTATEIPSSPPATESKAGVKKKRHPRASARPVAPKSPNEAAAWNDFVSLTSLNFLPMPYPTLTTDPTTHVAPASNRKSRQSHALGRIAAKRASTSTAKSSQKKSESAAPTNNANTVVPFPSFLTLEPSATDSAPALMAEATSQKTSPPRTIQKGRHRKPKPTPAMPKPTKKMRRAGGNGGAAVKVAPSGSSVLSSVLKGALFDLPRRQLSTLSRARWAPEPVVAATIAGEDEEAASTVTPRRRRKAADLAPHEQWTCPHVAVGTGDPCGKIYSVGSRRSIAKHLLECMHRPCDTVTQPHTTSETTVTAMDQPLTESLAAVSESAARTPDTTKEESLTATASTSATIGSTALVATEPPVPSVDATPPPRPRPSSEVHTLSQLHGQSKPATAARRLGRVSIDADSGRPHRRAAVYDARESTMLANFPLAFRLPQPVVRPPTAEQIRARFAKAKAKLNATDAHDDTHTN